MRTCINFLFSLFCSVFCFPPFSFFSFSFPFFFSHINTQKSQLSLCNEPLKESSNPGASGSIFYISNDDEFIIKTVQKKEAEFLQKLLPGYFMVGGVLLYEGVDDVCEWKTFCVNNVTKFP